MSRTLHTSLVTAKNALHSTTPDIWLANVQIDASNSWNLARYQTNVTAYEGTSAPYSAVTYYAFPWEFDVLEADNRGTLFSCMLKVSNVTREFMKLINESSDLSGKIVRLRLTRSDSLGDSSNATKFYLDQKLYILNVPEIDNRDVRFELGHYTLLIKRAPSQVYDRNRCRFVFGSAKCAFPQGVTGTFTGAKDGFDLSQVSVSTCDLGLATPNGCRAHGALEKVAGLPVLHPRRFGGFPGIVKGPGY